jgi:2-polyprenyl-6-methoxyphenol hydroxylase-like FAD-dependent oxidoreductase
MKTNVLIIGAGPTGLMAACLLQRLGIDWAILDKKEGLTRESRALVVHARSLEIFEQMGIAGEAVKQGEILKKIQFIIKGKKLTELSLGNIGEGMSQFPYLLVLEQSKNERLLYDYLTHNGGEVLWQTEMVSIKKSEEGCLVEAQNQGKHFSIQADWVIAADGGKSSVRHYLNIPFEGSTYEHIFYVADTRLKWQWGHEILSLYLSRKSFLGLFPMKGEDRFRVIGLLPVSFQNESPESFEQISPSVQQDIEVPLHFSETNWFSVYRLHHRCVRHFKAGRVFFAGDAAHIHSPVGGQGMNTGLQDAYNLAWKLAYVIEGFASTQLLSTYEQERLPFARQLVATTDRAFSVITSDKWYHRLLRLYLIPLFIPLAFLFHTIRRKAFKTVSQIGIRYINSDLTVNRLAHPLTVKAGERFPYMLSQNGESIYQLMKEPLFYALTFDLSGKNLAKEVEAVQKDFPFLQVLDLSSEKALIRQLRVKRNTIILVRPDHYIGLITDQGVKVMWEYLKIIRTV